MKKEKHLEKLGLLLKWDSSFKLKRRAVLTALLILSALFILVKRNEPVVIPVTFSENNRPVVEISIGKNLYPMELSLFSKFPLYLTSTHLANISKISKGEADWKNAHGEEFKGLLYEIKKVQMDKLTLKAITTVETNASDKEQESINWPFDQMNLLLDFPHHKILGINREKDLKSYGYDLQKMKKVKCSFLDKGIFFDCETPFGKMKTLLNTGASKNVIHQSLDVPPNFQLTIVQKDYEETQFFPYDFSPEIGCDLILSVDFLKKHIVYIDAKNECIYIGERHSNTFLKGRCAKIPVEFSVSGTPIVDITIGKESYQAMIDLGSAFELTCPPHIFPKDNMRFIKNLTAINGLGNEREAKCYNLPVYTIGNSSIYNVSFYKKSGNGVSTGYKGKDQGKIKRKDLVNIGYPILYRTNLFFDFQYQAIWSIQEEKDFHAVGLNLENYTKIPFELQNFGMVIDAQSDLGNLKLLIDTGATVSLLNTNWIPEEELEQDLYKNPIFRSSIFVLERQDFGNTSFYPFDISEKLGGFNAVLGMDFLKKHPFYIDFQNRNIYFKNPD